MRLAQQTIPLKVSQFHHSLEGSCEQARVKAKTFVRRKSPILRNAVAQRDSSLSKAIARHRRISIDISEER